MSVASAASAPNGVPMWFVCSSNVSTSTSNYTHHLRLECSLPAYPMWQVLRQLPATSVYSGQAFALAMLRPLMDFGILTALAEIG